MAKKILEVNEDLFLGESKIHNKGIFALNEIPAKKNIIEYTGELISKKEGTRREEESIEKSKTDPSKAGTYIIEIDEENDLDGDVKENYAKYINHSCEPNCEFDIVGKKVLVNTIKKIKEGEELLLNYGFEWNEKEFHKHPCKCGSQNCAGYILEEKSWSKLKNHLKEK